MLAPVERALEEQYGTPDDVLEGLKMRSDRAALRLFLTWGWVTVEMCTAPPMTPSAPSPTLLSDYLELLGPQLPAALVKEEQWARLQRVARHLPAALVSMFTLELHLDDPEARVDLEVCADVISGGREILAGRNRAIALPKSLENSPTWAQVRRFCTRWATPEHLLHDSIYSVWLEFDLPPHGPDAAFPDPSFFFGPQGGESAAPVPWRRAEEILQCGYGELLGEPLPADVSANLRRCLRALPGKSRIFGAGMMLARRDARLRLGLEDLTPEESVAFIRAVRSAEDASRVREQLEWARRYVDKTALTVDVGADVGETLGLELYIEDRGRQDATHRGWELLLEQLVSRGLCRPALRDALLASTGNCRESQHRERWPKDLSGLSRLLKMESVLTWRPLHVKLVCRPGEAPRAKAYLLVSNTWAWP